MSKLQGRWVDRTTISNFHMDHTDSYEFGGLLINGDASFLGRSLFSGDITVSGLSSLGTVSTLDLTTVGSASVSGNLKVDSSVVVGSSLTLDGSVISGASDIYVVPASMLSISGKLSVSGDSSISGDMTVGNMYLINACGPAFRQNVFISLFNADETVSLGDGKKAIPVGCSLDGWRLVDALATVDATGVTNTTNVMIRRKRDDSNADMLSTPIIISGYFAYNGVISPDCSTVAKGDKIYIDVDATHNNPPYGLSVTLTFEK